MMGHFLYAFARRTELYGELPEEHLRRVNPGVITVRRVTSQDWAALPPVLLDPVRDDIVRDLNGGADVRAVYACRDNATLYVRMDFRQPPGRRYTYTLALRPFGPQGETPARALTLRLNTSSCDLIRADGVQMAARGNTLLVAVPTRALESAAVPLTTLALSVETSLPGVTIDKTGVRLLDCDPAPTPTVTPQLSRGWDLSSHTHRPLARDERAVEQAEHSSK
jgi:hypothetical protein